jgi:flagellar protein FliS
MNPQQFYREAGVLGASPVELVIRLYEKMIDDLRQVSDAIEKNETRRRTDRIKHAILIVGHLQSSLDFEKGGKVARDLELFYNNFRDRLLYVQFHPSVRAAGQLITDLLALREAWIRVQQAEKPGTAETASGAASSGALYAAADVESDRVPVNWQG